MLSRPSLSDDIYRYVWEGKIVAAGENPYRYPPDSEHLKALRDSDVYPFINNARLPAIYPPLAQVFFAAAASVSPMPAAMKAFFCLFDIGLIFVLIAACRQLSRTAVSIIVYAWNPLIIMEFAGSGHLDSAGMFFLMVSLVLFCAGRNVWSLTSLAGGALVKIVPILALPFMVRRISIGSFAFFMCLVCAAYIPFRDAGSSLFYSLGIYAEKWMFNASLFYLCALAMDSLGTARIACGIMFAGIYSLILIRYAKAENISANMLYYCVFLVLGATVILSPVVHPWYVCWIVPFLVLYPMVSWIALSGTVFLSYYVLKQYAETGVWAESPIVTCMVYIPFYSILLFELVSKKYTGKG